MAVSSVQAGIIYEQKLEGNEFPIGNQLKWSTAEENGNARFIVEKSTDGITYENIGNINGIGDSESLQDYSFLDVQATDKKSFYRLKQIDFDGAYNYSHSVIVQKELSNKLVVMNFSGVEIKDKFDITFDAFRMGDLTYQIIDFDGVVALEGTEFVSEGLFELSIDATDLLPEKYKIVFTFGEEKEEFIILKDNYDIEEQKENVAQKDDGTRNNR